ncbi:hypothetical protein [Mycobacteroides abscessus]|uniref:hypothetical protein n=1 Tax=Mycobacteroides abscessus TaxID=36809 RepID=UPI00092CBCBB|nr:hypothetical protein [Mycobacteroides abscessus]SIE26335.1 Uncharacterised protein [Mycobacteroides abscessus subsp. abscessus]SIE51500.1 Uncharacterised protein [Mycobacteroides abscessus subsp. abscessus]
MDDLIGRIDDLLDDEYDDIPWVDAWHWAPPEVELPSGVWDEQPDRELDSGWDYHPDAQIHVIPVEQVAEWLRCLGTMPRVEREDIQWYVVCHEHKLAGGRDVPCGCGNPQ